MPTSICFLDIAQSHTPFDVCGVDYGDAIGQCSVPLRRGEQYFYDTAKKARNFEASREGSERVRHQMIRVHPRTVPHFSPVGYKKMRLPDEAWNVYKTFWEENKHRGVPELWPASSSYVNHWDRPVTMVHNTHTVKLVLFETMRKILTDWVNVTMDLEQVSCYGTRLYHDGHFLRNHVDITSTHVISAIIHIDHDYKKPWPLEVIGHDGLLTRVQMDAQDIVLYESASVIHGRPEIFRGEFFAGTFIHFKPREGEIWADALQPMNDALREERKVSTKDGPILRHQT